ncbi:hypothetical protein ACLQ3B_10375 [Micromonospora sp. DT53]|uniref:hypothetical protein n=1 Tax=Micromonospora sp. DT53 TaxID=3393444 RepID=UPI003CF27CD9
MLTLHTAALLRHDRDDEPVPEHAVLVSGDRVEAVGPLATAGPELARSSPLWSVSVESG